MQICEYENVQCPYCGKDKLKDMRKTMLNQHMLVCISCLGIFFIPCED